MARFFPLTRTRGPREAMCCQPGSAICRDGKPAPALRVHVVGCSPAGTSLMADLLRDAYSFAGEAVQEQSLFEPVKSPAYPYLSQSAEDTSRLQDAFSADPELFVIAVVCDPRSVITSQQRSRAASGPVSADGSGYDFDFKQWRDAMLAIKALNPKGRCLQIRSESLLANPTRVLQQIEAHFRFLRSRKSIDSVAWKKTQNAATETAANNFTSDGTQAWHSHLPRIRSQLDEHPDLAEWLINAGYEPDDSWTRQLAEVEPAAPTVRRQAFAAVQELQASLRYWWRARRYLSQRSKLGAIAATRQGA